MTTLGIIRSAYKNSKTRKTSGELYVEELNNMVRVCVILAVASIVLTILNIVKHYQFMALTTGILVAGFCACILICKVFKNKQICTIILAVLVAFIFTIYATKGENEGFAILWTLLVPPIGMTFLGFRVGTALSFYFQVLMILLFYTPIRDMMSEFYTATFMGRYPVLYAVSMFAAIYLAAQKEYYSRQVENMAYLDVLTGIGNRRQYTQTLDEITEDGNLDKISILSIDVNRLKYVNDTFGHEFGDQLIIGTAVCLQKAFPDAETICRMGGDEFAVISLKKKSVMEAEIKTLKKLNADWSTPNIDGISLSLGLACASDYKEPSIMLLERAADEAMYKSKSDFYLSSGLDRRK